LLAQLYFLLSFLLLLFL